MAKSPILRSHKQVAMDTSRNLGAVGEFARVPPIVRRFALPQHDILDYGSGKHAAHSAVLRAAGFNVTSHDYHGSTPEGRELGVHDPDALKRRYHIVFASNVLNTQNTGRHLARTLNEIARATHPAEGMAIVNLTQSPRKDAFKGMTNQQGNEKVERALKRRFHHVERVAGEAGHSPVWIAKHPKNAPPSEQAELQDA